MGTISLSLPQVGQPNTSQEPLIPSDFTTIQTWANGNIDGANVVASLTGRRMVAQVLALVPGGTAANNYFVAIDGTLVASASTTTKGLQWWYLDPANYAVVGKANTQMLLRIAAATNSTAPGGTCNVGAQVNALTFSGGAGVIAPTIGAVQTAGGFGATLTGNSAAVTESTTVAIPAAGAYAPVVTIVTAGTAANSVISLLLQLFVLNN